MSHQNLPTQFLQQIALLAAIKTKVDTDGATGPLVGMLSDRSISLTDDTAAGVTALNHDKNFLAHQKLSRKYCAQRDALLNVVENDMGGCFQFIKSLNGTNYSEVGDWGADISTSGKITYPTDPVAIMNMFGVMKAKHESYTTPVSPLLVYLTTNAISLTIDATNGASALAKNVLFLSEKLSSENSRALRDTVWDVVNKHIHTIANFLGNLYPKAPTELGLYGIQAVAGTRTKKSRTLLIPINSIKLGIKANVGSSVDNTGSNSLNIFPGKIVSGTPVVLTSGESFVLPSGYSTFSIQNPSMTTVGEVDINPA